MTESSIFWVCWQNPIVYGHWNENSLTLGLILNFPLINSYIIENGVCYLTLTEKTFSKRAAFSFLEELSSEFQREFGSRVPTATRPYSFIEFGEWLDRGNVVLLKLKAQPPKKKEQMFLVQNLVKKKNVGCFFLFLLFPTFSYYCHLNAMFLCKNLQEVTGRTSSLAWNLWKPFTYCSIEENSFRDLTVWNLNDDIASI